MVADRGQNDPRRLSIGHAVLKLDIRHPGIGYVVAEHFNHLNRGGQALELLVFWVSRPTADLLIGDQYDALACELGIAAAGLGRQINGRGGSGRAIDRLDCRQGFQSLVGAGVGFVVDATGGTTDRNQRDHTASRQAFNQLTSLCFALSQNTAVKLLVAGAQAIVD